jgi:isopentenyl-diphosphate delta-isomerase type 1
VIKLTNVQDEIYDVVDETDQVIGQATRREIHQRNLLHRSIHILVFNSQNELFSQKRSMTKDENPGLWDISSAGHVDSGETYDDCAHRELWEELGIKAILKPLEKIEACQETYQEHAQIYTCRTNTTIKINFDEISEGKYFNLRVLESEIQKNPEQFTSSFKLILIKYGEMLSMNTSKKL